jgi:hypothetical protein
MLKLKPCAYGMAIALLPASALADRTVASTAPVTAPANVSNASAESPKPLEAATSLDYEEPDRLLLPGKVKHGGYGAPEVKFTTMTGDPAVLVGFQGGWIINHGFVIGAAGYGLSTTHDAPAALSLPSTRSTLQFGYGGPRLGYVIRRRGAQGMFFAMSPGEAALLSGQPHEPMTGVVPAERSSRVNSCIPTSPTRA